MSLTKRGRTYFLIAILSFLFSYLIITLNYFPFLGISLTLITFAFFTYKRVRKTKKSKYYLLSTLIFSFLLALRSEPIVTFLNLSASIFFGVLMLANLEEKPTGFLDYITAPINLFIKSIITKSEYYPEFKKDSKNSNQVNVMEIFFGIVISIFVLLIILPLLSSTNPFFENIVKDILDFFNLKKLLENIVYQSLFLWAVRLFFFIIFLLFIPKITTLIEEKNNYSLPATLKTGFYPLSIPKLVTAIVLIIFFVTQIQFYFADEMTLQTLNLSHSQRAREVFGQLCVVAGIVIILVYNSQVKKGFSDFLNWMLGFQGVFLILMAYKSDLEYINAYGFTYIRLYGFTLATLIAGVFVLFYKDYLHKNRGRLPDQVIQLAAILLILVNLVNFDYIIYHFNKARTGEGTDYGFLSTLSPDSLSYKNQFDLLQKATFDENFAENYDNGNPNLIIYKIERLQDKYSNFDLRTFNILEFAEYQNIKSIDTQSLRDFVNHASTHKD